ncbi:MAG: sigma-70 family RNA polymerase sigma factor [Wenzhouxiangella sp.]|nr:sigma-70 family RNA polymerase sigma factor [Wenzhouxiangella sp.]MCH8478289.1 sigma-70 family RNA polymerase sigma factor [Wenzhouxiangella sp.]TVR93334.1 MAG: sigma-70 family RNA polymerase sigma factor [Wenzhouxiangellaceae bacterium]
MPNEQLDSSEQLIERICRADETALAELFDRLADHAYAIAVGILRDADDADEVINDVFARVWRQAERFDPERGSAASWIGVMVRSQSLDRLRQRRRHAALSLHPEDNTIAYSEEDEPRPDQATEQALLSRLTRRALAGLSDAQSQVLRMAYFRDLSHRDIAEMLQLPLGTVKSHCRRGLGRLRQVLVDIDPASR